MKQKPADWEWDKKPKRVEKGTNKAGKHRKSIYNMLSEYDKDYDEDNDDGMFTYASNVHYDKQR